MSQRLADVLQPHLDAFDTVLMVDVGPGGTFTHFLTDLPRPSRTGMAPSAREVGVVRLQDTERALDQLTELCATAPVGALIAALLPGSTATLTSDAVAGAVMGSGAEVLAVATTVYPSFPLLVLVRRSVRTQAGAAEALVEALERSRESPEGSGTSVAVVDLPPEVRARLDRMRAETARMRMETRTAQARAVKAEKQLRWAQASTAWKIGRLLVGIGKRPISVFRLPRELWALWRLRIARRRGTNGGAPVERPPLDTELAEITGSALLRPRLGPAAASAAALSIVAVVDDDTATTLAPYATITRVSPHNAGEITAAVDPDLVLIDTAVAEAPGPWLHLGNPAATDRELALLAMVTAAHDQGRPVALVRSGDLSLSAGLHDLAHRCDLVLATSAEGLQHWSAGLDLAASYAPAGGERRGSVFIGDLSLRMSPHTRAAVVERLRGIATDGLTIHPRADRLTAYPAEWPEDLRPFIGRAVSDAEITSVLAGAVRAIVTGPDDPMAARAVAAGARPLAPGAPGAPPGPLTRDEHMEELNRLFDGAAAPARLRELCRLLHLTAPRIRTRDVAIVCPDAEPGIVPVLLRQGHRPREVAVRDDAGLGELSEAGISVRRSAPWSTGPLHALVDSPIVITASAADIRRWPRDFVRRNVLAHEVGMPVPA